MSSPQHAPIEEHHREIAKMLQHESDRGCALFGAAMLEDELESLLRAYCRTDKRSVKKVVDPLFRAYAPFSTFSAKIQVSYALGLIREKVYKALELFRKLRNDFAHEKTAVSFQSPKYRPQFLAILEIAKTESGPKDEHDPELILEIAKTESGPEDDSVPEDEHDLDEPKMGRTTRRQLVERLAFCLCIVGTFARIAVSRELIEMRLHQHEQSADPKVEE